MNFGKWFFNYSRKERLGILILVGIFMLSVTAWFFIHFSSPPTDEWEISTAELIQVMKSVENKKNESIPTTREINTMEINDWINLGGLSKASCSAIVNYKNQLGGFYDLSQIKEIVKIEDSTFFRWKKYTLCNPNRIRKIAVNKLNKNILDQHPYVGKGLSEVLIAIRENKNVSNYFEELSHILSETNVHRLKSYLIFE